MSTNRDNAPLLVLRGVNVQEDEYGNVCLNDLWTLAGGPENRRPVDWHRGKRAGALQAALDDRMVENLHYSGANPPQTYRAIGKGRGSRTFAHPVLALDYAEYLQPALGVEVREIFLRYRAADISLANDILDRIVEQVREDQMRVHIREEITVQNRDLAGEGKKAGCRGWEYAELHNAGYRGLYNGLDEGGIHRLKKLTKNPRPYDCCRGCGEPVPHNSGEGCDAGTEPQDASTSL